jgi:hypothetical protein
MRLRMNENFVLRLALLLTVIAVILAQKGCTP